VSYTDKILECRDCGQSFVFTSGEQEFFAEKGFAQEPRRCPDCRRARKNQNSDFGGGGGGGGYSRQMYSATCSSCGKEAQVPFEPSGDRPVYCRDCYQPRERSSGGGGGRSGGPPRRQRW
jgi:CxxC-x17-CxxC domain-containing protein